MIKSMGMLVNTFPSISETFILNQIVGLKKKGISPTIISLRKPDLSRVHPDFNKYNLQDSLIIVNLPGNMTVRMVKGAILALKWLFISPSKLFLAMNRRYGTASKSLKNLYILNALSKENFSLLHAHFGPNGLVGAFLKDAGYIEKIIVTFHGADINSYPKRYGLDVYSTLYTKTDLITANTLFTKEKIVNNGGDPQQIEILPVGLNSDDYPLRPDPQISEVNGDFRLLTVGRLVEKKGYPWVIDAVKQLVEKFPSLTYHIVGSGPKEDELKKMVLEMGLEKVVIFRGLLNADEVKEELSQAHVFVLASVTAANGDMEGQGLVLQEAQAMGVPVVSTLHNGIPDGVLDGESGYLVPEKDSHALVDKIELLLSDRDLRGQMGARGHSFVKENYTIELLTDKLIGFYQRAETS